MSHSTEIFWGGSRHVIIDFLLVTAIAGVAAVCTNINKACNGFSKAFVNISNVADEAGTTMSQLNKGFKPINDKILNMLDKADNQYFDQYNNSSVPGSMGWQIKQILGRVNDLLDPNDFKSDPRSMSGKVKMILDNLGDLSVRVKALGNNIDKDGKLDLNKMTGQDVDAIVASLHKLSGGVGRVSRDGALTLVPYWMLHPIDAYYGK